jgi:hypothetical protein
MTIQLENATTHLKNEGFTLVRRNAQAPRLLNIAQTIAQHTRELNVHRRTLSIHQRLLFAVKQRQQHTGTDLYARVWDHLGVDSTMMDKRQDIMEGIQETLALIDETQPTNMDFGEEDASDIQAIMEEFAAIGLQEEFREQPPSDEKMGDPNVGIPDADR